MKDLDELARMLFPNNKPQQSAFLAIFVDLKWAPQGFLSTLDAPRAQHGVGQRTFQKVRAKMRKLGLIDHVSRFSPRYGYREGWVLSSRFERALVRLADRVRDMKEASEPLREQKDRDSWRYL